MTAAAAKAKALAGTMKSISETKELVEAVATFQEQVAELQSAATTCAHPETDRAGWASHAQDLLPESVDTIEALRAVRGKATELREQANQLAKALSDWAEAPPRERAAQAEAMAVRVRAASDAVVSMHEEFLGAIFR